MTTVTYFVPSISCGNCKHTIETKLGVLQGVQYVNVELSTKQVVILFDAPATEETIKTLLTEINYPVKDDAIQPSTNKRSCCG
jgi:copper chaperone